MELKPGYKQTEVGAIPEGWSVKKLGDAVEFLDGRRRPVKDSDRAKMRGEFPYYGASGVVDYVNDFLFDEDLILLGEDGENILSRNCRLAFRVSGKIWVNNHAHVLRPKDGIDIGYLAEYLESLNYEQYNTGTAQPKLNKLVCSGIPVLRPPLEEQRVIAGALSDVDALISGLDQLIAKKRDFKQAAMQQLLTGKRRLPGFRGDWEAQTIEQLEKARLIRLSRGTVISKTLIERVPGDFPIYSSSVKSNGVFGYYGEFMFNEELITWSIDGGGHFFYRPRHKFSVTNVCGFMRVDTSKLCYQFLAAQLQLLHRSMNFDYQDKAHPSVIRKAYSVLIPALDEQRAVAAVHADMNAEIAALEQRLAKTHALKQGMMQQLLTGRTRLI